uniref:Pentraxin (PTX) domain-containing protein n=1 Tax=Monopterus albus TaxID=43700 RepID=A0A3Q3Q9G8_MONAL|nr:neuronal pentraxin-1-like [Monopterus albus]
MARDIIPLSFMPLSVRLQRWVRASLGFFPLHSLMLFCFLTGTAATNTVTGIEYDYGISPKFVCIPIPPDADPSCYSPPNVAHRPSSNGNSHNGSNRRGVMSDEAKATILHLRESLVRQKETILDQRETIRELTTKLTLCKGFGGHHSISHHDNRHNAHDTHHKNHHDTHHDDHHGHHGSHHASSSLHHGPSVYRTRDHHYSHSNHRSDPHHRKTSSYSKHSSISPEQTGKTLQTLKERMESLQARNSSSFYSSSLRELLQRKISVLEEQLHSYYQGHHDNGHHDDHHNSSPYSDHLDGHHSNGHHGTGHHDNHHDSHQYSHHSNHHARDYDHRYNWHCGQHHSRYGNHHDHYDYHDHRRDDHDDCYDNHHGNDHHDNQHNNDHHLRQLPLSGKEMSLQGAGHSKLETVLSQLHHGSHKELESPITFLLDFPMRTNYMYARVKPSVVSELFTFTICLWLKARAGPGFGTPFSYAVPGQANELVLIQWGSNPVELLINDKAVTLPITMTDGKWHHVCVTWSTHDGIWEAYQDGVEKGSGQNLSAWHHIRPGGTLILGQEQDTMGGHFDVTQSFMGELSDVQFWSRVLAPKEIHSQATCRGHLVGDVMSWSEESVELHGGLRELPFDPCH